VDPDSVGLWIRTQAAKITHRKEISEEILCFEALDVLL
jgi:hypothetical protein